MSIETWVEIAGVGLAMTSIWLTSDRFARKRKYGFSVGLVAATIFCVFFTLNRHWWMLGYSLFRIGVGIRGILNNRMINHEDVD